MGTIVNSIGTTGRDYSTMQAWVDALPANLVTNGNSYVGECYNDSQFTNTVTIPSHTTDSSHFITLKCHTGESFTDNVNRNTNALRYNQANGVGIRSTAGGYNETLIAIACPYTVIDGLQVSAETVPSQALSVTASNVVVKNCFLLGTPRNNFSAQVVDLSGGLLYNSIVVLNTNNVAAGISMQNGSKAINCTIVRPSNFSALGNAVVSRYTTHTIKNCALFGWATDSPGTWTADGHNGTDWTSAPGSTGNITGMTYANQFVQPNATTGLDLRLKSGNGLSNNGTDASADIGVSTDIFGNARINWDIGAFEAANPATAITLSGPSGGANGAASTNFTVGANGAITGTVVVTPSSGAGGGTFTPTTVSISSGSPTGTFTYTPATQGTKTISVINNGSLTNPSSLSYASNSVATAVTLTLPTGKMLAGTQSSNFTVGSDGSVVGTVIVTPSDNGAGGSFSPTTVSLVGSGTATFKYTPAIGGNVTFSVTNNGSLTNPSNQTTSILIVTPTAPATGLIVKSIGSGKDYATIKDFGTYLGTLDLVALQTSVIAEVYGDEVCSFNTSVVPVSSDATYNCIIQPVPGIGVNDYDPTGTPYDYGTQGVELTFNNNALIFGCGVTLRRFRINVTAGGVTFGSQSNTGTLSVLSQNRIKINVATGGVFGFSNYLSKGNVFDNLFIQESGNTRILACAAEFKVERNTFVRRGTATANTGLIDYDNSFSLISTCTIKNNAFIGCGTGPLTGSVSSITSGNISNNISNTTLTTPITGVAISTSPQLVNNIASDYTPYATGALVGAASVSAQGTLDQRGLNRGEVPDVGALQGVVVTPFPGGAITSTSVSGQSITISGTISNGPTSGLASLLVGVTPNGAVATGPVSVTILSTTFTVTFNGVTPGNYAIPVVTLTNSGGSSVATGGSTFTIIPISGSPNAPQSNATATVVTVTGASATNVGVGVSLTISTDSNLTGSQTETITFSDGAGGTFSPSTINLNSTVTADYVTYTPTAAGSHTVVAAPSGTPTLSAGALTVNATNIATQVTVSGASTGLTNTAQTLTIGTNNVLIGSQTEHVIFSDGSTGVFSPTSVTLTPGSPTATVSYTPNTTPAIRTVTATANTGTPTITAGTLAINVFASAATAIVSTSPPIGAGAGKPSAVFTISANGFLASNTIVTPSDSGGGGVFTPSTITLSSTNPVATFRYTSSNTEANHTISYTNNRSLTNPSSSNFAALLLSGVTSTGGYRKMFFGRKG